MYRYFSEQMPFVADTFQDYTSVEPIACSSGQIRFTWKHKELGDKYSTQGYEDELTTIKFNPANGYLSLQTIDRVRFPPYEETKQFIYFDINAELGYFQIVD